MFNEGSSLALDHKCQPMKGVPLQRKFQLGLMISCFYPFQMYDIHENRNNESSRDLSRVQIGLELIVCKVGGGENTRNTPAGTTCVLSDPLLPTPSSEELMFVPSSHTYLLAQPPCCLPAKTWDGSCEPYWILVSRSAFCFYNRMVFGFNYMATIYPQNRDLFYTLLPI